MESETWKLALDTYLPELTDRLPTVIDDLIRRMKRHISNDEYYRIRDITNPGNKIERLVDAISTRKVEDFDAFCKALDAVKQNDLAEKLKQYSDTKENYTSIISYKEDLKSWYRDLPSVSVDNTFNKLPSQYISLQLHKIDKANVEELTLSGYVDDLLRKDSAMSLPAMFNVKGVKKKAILVEGGPGMGKSTLAIKICKCWADDALLENYDAVILLILRDPEVQKSESISDLLQIPNEELRDKVYKEIIKTKGEKICFIFEGYDELPLDLREKPVFAKLMDKLPKCTLVYTSRPEACRKLYNSVSRRINILGFKEAQIYQYIESVFDDNQEQAKKLISQVKQNHIIQSIMSTPINVAIICHIYSTLIYLPTTLTELYNYLCILLIVRHVKTRISPNADVWFSSLDELPTCIQKEFNSLCFMAYKGREKGQVVFSSRELKVYKIHEQDMSGLGLLLIAPTLSLYGDEKSYNFLHLTLQEFCAAKYISKLSSAEQLNCFKDNHCNSNFNMIWKFYSGITKLANNEVFSNMLPSKRVNSPYGRRKTVDLLHYVFEADSKEHFIHAGNHISGTVYFRGCDVDHISCTSLAKVLSHSNKLLKEFDFSGCQLSELSLTIVCESLINTFEMQKCQLQDSGFTLDLSYNCVTDTSLSLVGHMIKQNFPLVSLNLGDCDIKGEISTLCDACKINATLTKLTISSCSLDASVMPILCQMLEQNHNLKTLDLSRNDIGPEGMVCFIDTKNISVVNLILHKCKQNSLGAANIGKFLTKNSSIVFIDLSFNAIGDDGVKELMYSLTMNSTLQQLDLKSNKITSAGAISICDYLTSDSPSLTSIVVAKNPIEDGICNTVEAVKGNIVLKEIDFTQTTTSMVVSPNDMEKIIVKLNSLKFSPLDDTVITGLDKTNTLQNLRVLRGTDCGYRTVINSMKKNNSVRKLDFQHNHLSQYTMLDLSALVKTSTALKELILNCVRVDLNDWSLLAEGLVLNTSLKQVMIGAFPIELDQPTTLKFLEIIKQNLTIEELLLRITQEDIQDKWFMHKVEMQVDQINQHRNLHKALPLHVEIL